MKPVAILGCGPAGLMAAHAVAMRGKPVAVFSIPQKSRLGGAQFLHEPIPGINDVTPDIIVNYKVEGDPQTYEQKVYSDTLTVPFVSMSDKFDGQTQQAWNLLATYDKLWSIFGESVNDVRVTPEWIEENADEFDLMVSTVPLPSLCRANHHFTTQQVTIANQCFDETLADNTVFYNGTRDRSWYRCAKLFGIGSTEWGAGVNPPYDTVKANKPIRSNCDCWPNILKAGRFGTWKKGVLTHQAFTSTFEALL